MFKFIPEEFLKDNYTENISHYNFYNLLDNYENILNFKNFNLTHNWSQPILDKYILKLKEKLKDFKEVFDANNESLENDYFGTQKQHLESSIQDFDDNINFYENHLEAIFKNKFFNKDSEIKNNLLYHCKPKNENSPFLIRDNISVIKNNLFVNLNYTTRKWSRFSRYTDFITILNSTTKYEPENLYKKELKKYIFQQYINEILFSTWNEVNDFLKTSNLKNVAMKYLLKEENLAQSLEEINDETSVFDNLFLNWFKQRFVNEDYGYFDTLEEYFLFLENNENTIIFDFDKNDINFRIYSYNDKRDRINKIADLFSKHIWLEEYLIFSNLLSFINYSQLTTLTNEAVHLDMYNENLIFVKKEHDCLRRNKLLFSNFHSNGIFLINPNITSLNSHDVIEKKEKQLNKVNYLNSEINYENYLGVKFKTHFVKNNDHIYSRFNKDFLDLFGKKIIKIDDDIFCDLSNKEYSLNLPIESNSESNSKNVNFFLNSNTCHILTYSCLNNEQKTYFKNYLNENGKNKTKVIYCPGLNNKSKKKYPFIQGTTLKTVMTKKGFLVPVMLPFIHLNENNEQQKSWNFCLLNFNEDISYNYYNSYFDKVADLILKDLCNADRNDSFIFINSLLKNLFDYNSLILKDPDEYERLKYSKFDCVSQYTQNNAILFYNAFKKNQSVNTQNKFMTKFNQAKQLINPALEKNVLNIFAKVKIDENVQLDYNKVKKRYDKVNFKLKELKQKESEYQELIVNIEDDIKRLVSLAEEKKQRLLTKQQSLQEQKEEIESFQNQYTTIFDLMNQKRKEYKRNYELNFNKKNYELNSFLKNISKNNINLSYILFSMKDDPNNLFLYYSKSDYLQIENFNLEDYYYGYYDSEYDHDYNDLVAQMEENELYPFENDNIHLLQSLLQDNNYCIKKVCFTTVKPSLIKIDNKEKYVVGGPYRIVVTNDKVKIGLLNFSSIMGVDNINKPENFKPHPHSNTTNLYDILNRPEETLLKPTNGCLGEASSIIYHAFKENDLCKILLSTMIWVKSANSADVWGKTYKWFPEPNNVNFEFDALSDLPTSSEINSFIDSELETIEVIQDEEPTEEDIFRMETEELQEEVQEEQVEETQTNNQQGIEAFNTNETYVRYTRT